MNKKIPHSNMASNLSDDCVSSKYREFMSKLADELTENNLKKLKFLLKDSLAGKRIVT